MLVAAGALSERSKVSWEEAAGIWSVVVAAFHADQKA